MSNHEFIEEGNFKKVWDEYENAVFFNQSINLNETVEANENFFVGKQWEGVASNGLPTPVFNFLKRITLFQVASITTDNIKMQASALSASGDEDKGAEIAEMVNTEFEYLFEHNKLSILLREYTRNAAVDGDACMYSYWDPNVPSGHSVPGAIRTEIIENTRVFFGNPNDRRVQSQPYIILSSRDFVSNVRKRAKENGSRDWESIVPDSDERATRPSDKLVDGKVTVLLKFWKDSDSGKIHCYESTRSATVKDSWDTGLRLYPITWLNWDYIQDCYHGQALITGLIPNQIFVNKLFAMAMISLMTTAYPKIVYDKTRISKWDSRVGTAIGVNGGDMGNVAKIIDPAQISPHIGQFIDLAVSYTQTFLGATSAALGDVRPDNTSAIIALQRASAIPSEITKQNLYQSIEDLGRIYMDMMGAYYGTRVVDGLPRDYSVLQSCPMSLKLDVGASAYWSEIASMQTLDGLLTQGLIGLDDYLERIPDGYISKKQELIEKIRSTAVEGGDGQAAPPLAEN